MNPTPTRLPRVASAIERASLADAAYESLLEAILSGQLVPGSSLNSVLLAAQLEVSRTPVQEAIRRLVADGLAEQKGGYQARVIALTRDDIEAVYELRILLEGEAAQRSAARLTDAQLVELRAGADQLAACADDFNGNLDWPPRAIAYDIRFHDVVAANCGNRRLAADIGRYRLLVRSLCRLTGSRDILRQAFEEHLRVLAALEARNGAEARRAMTAHIAARLKTVLAAVAK